MNNTYLEDVIYKEELRRKVDREIQNLSSMNDYNIEFERIGDVLISNDGKLNAYLKKKTRLFKWVKVYTYCTGEPSTVKFLWKMADDCFSEVELSTRRKDTLEIKGIVGSRSKIVGKLPDDIYIKVKDKVIDIKLDFITNPYDLTVSIYEVSSTSLEYEMSKFQNSKSQKQIEGFNKYQEDYERRKKYINELVSIIDIYSKNKSF